MAIIQVSKPVQVSRGELNKMVAKLAAAAGGEGTAQLLGSKGLAIKIRGVLSTQCPAVDVAIGRGGIPLARLTILTGPEGCGKTTLALHLVAECQRQGGIAVYNDAEYKLDPDYAKKLGVNLDELMIIQPPYLERVFAVIETTVESAREMRIKMKRRIPILIVLDSMNAAISKAAYEGDWEQQQMADVARIYSQKLPKLIPLVSREDVALVFISQVREKIGVMFGDKEDTAGGRAPRFYASLIINVKRVGSETDPKTNIRMCDHNQAYIAKNQIAPPFRKAEFDIVYGKGVDYFASLIKVAVAKGLVKQNGQWYVWNGHKYGPGIKKAARILAQKHNSAMQLVEGVYGQGCGGTADSSKVGNGDCAEGTGCAADSAAGAGDTVKVERKGGGKPGPTSSVLSDDE